MSDFTVEPAELDAAAGSSNAFAAGIGGLRATAPDVAMYGELVGSAAAHAEPANTESINTLLAALATLGESLATRCTLTAAAYRTTESTQQERVAGVEAGLQTGSSTVARGTAV